VIGQAEAVSVAAWFMVIGAAIFGFLGVAYWATRLPSRALPASVSDEVRRLSERRPNQHVVDLELADGRVVRKVWIAWGKYPAMFGGRTIRGRYRPRDAVHAIAHSN
jgi:hypothetical protein